jgi:CHAT domain-containing protein
MKRQGINALLLSVDRNLQGIPFAALPIEGGNLVDQVAITITPSLELTDLRQRAPKGSHRTLLAGASRFSNGLAPLSMAPEELRQIASIYPGAVVMLDGAFQARSLLKQALEEPLDILHLATHAEFVDQRADGARIYTSNGELSLQELGRQLRQKQTNPIALFVLNACRTAIGNEDTELGMAGLALQAGAITAMGNLWYVDDVVSAAFSVQFHRLMNQGMHKDQALQKTQQLFRKGDVFVQGEQIVNASNQVLLSGLSRGDQQKLRRQLSHPYYWAGAILSGTPW